MATKELEKTDAEVRHPVVSILGHIDHGKTTLLDTIRNSRVAEKESGGITQHVSAYEIQWKDKRITFIDTPGHEVFSKMRARGARFADVAVLVVAADDGVKPQTKEAYEAIKSARIPYLVALTKIDRTSADQNKVKSELAELGILVEGWGGSVPCVALSAKEKRNIDEFLDTILLLAELEELKGDPKKPAQGVVIEAHMDSRRGPTGTLLITSGCLEKGMFIVAGRASAPVRVLETTGGTSIKNACQSTPVIVAGFDEVPDVGDTFRVYISKSEVPKKSTIGPQKSDAKAHEASIGLLIRADVAGSYEAVMDEIKKRIPDGLNVKMFEGGVGDVTENDIKALSAVEKSFVIGYRTKIKSTVQELADRYLIRIATFDVIYEALDWITNEWKQLVPKKFIRDEKGSLLVLRVFGNTQNGRIIGGEVKSGSIPSDARFDIVRGGEVVGAGRVIGLQRNKVDVSQLREGSEGGLLVESRRAIEERDTLLFYYEREA